MPSIWKYLGLTTPEKPKLVKLHDGNPKITLLQQKLWEVIQEDRFDELPAATVVGVIEFLKWNLINRSD